MVYNPLITSKAVQTPPSAKLVSSTEIDSNGIAKSYDTSLFDFLRNYLAVFQNGCTIFHITMSHVGEFQFFLIPINICHAPSFLSQSFYWMWNIIDCGFDSSTLAWKIPWTEEPSRLQSMGSLRVRYNWATSLSLFTFILNCDVGEDSWESLGLQGDPTSPFWRRSALGFLWKEWC